MANPVLVDCPLNTWTKVATSVRYGNIWPYGNLQIKYFQTYRLTGEAAPTDKNEGVQLGEGLPISSSVDIDVYIYAEDEKGKVRVDV